jgi:uncharacterized protein (DUF302 family)
MGSNKFVIERQSSYGFEKTLELLTVEAEKREWKVPAVHDLQLSLAKSGKAVRPVKVLEICKPQYSGQMLELNDERIMSVMMPCRISIYEKENGLIYIGLLNAGEMTAGLPGTIAKVMKAAADEILEIAEVVS